MTLFPEAFELVIHPRKSLHVVPADSLHTPQLQHVAIICVAWDTHSFAVRSNISVTAVDLVSFLSWPTIDRPK